MIDLARVLHFLFVCDSNYLADFLNFFNSIFACSFCKKVGVGDENKRHTHTHHVYAFSRLNVFSHSSFPSHTFSRTIISKRSTPTAADRCRATHSSTKENERAEDNLVSVPSPTDRPKCVITALQNQKFMNYCTDGHIRIFKQD